MERPRSRSQLPNNLPQLQNLIKRDPLAYKDEVLCVSLVPSPVEIEDLKVSMLQILARIYIIEKTKE